jgi:hypothetical protein
MSSPPQGNTGSGGVAPWTHRPIQHGPQQCKRFHPSAMIKEDAAIVNKL